MKNQKIAVLLLAFGGPAQTLSPGLGIGRGLLDLSGLIWPPCLPSAAQTVGPFPEAALTFEAPMGNAIPIPLGAGGMQIQ